MQDIENIAKSNSAKIRFGILCNSYSLKKWQINTIEKLLESGNTELCLLVINAEETEKKTGIKKVLSWFGKNLIYRAYKRFFFKIDSLKEIDISQKLKDIPAISCLTSKKGKYSEYFSDNDVAEIKKYGLDFLLRFGFNIIRGKVLSSATYGIWSFHHDDERKYRGGPAGFWEIYQNDPVNGAILQRLTDSLDSGIILKKGYFKTIDHSYSANYDNLLNCCAKWPLQVCTDILNGTAYYFLQTMPPSKATIFKNPGNIPMLKFLAKLFTNKLKFHYNEFFQSEQWNVGIIKKSLEALVNEGLCENEIIMMPSQKRSNFRADSFAYIDEEKIKIFFENYDYKTRNGSFKSIEYTEKSEFENEKIVLEKPYHLSYPFIFSFNDNLYCVPESFENKQVDLYQIDKISGALSFQKTLLENTDAVDSTLFFNDKKWWLFCTKNSCNPNEELHLYFSENLEGPYFAHPANPVKTDIRSSRPAGSLFVKDGSIFRPAQDSSTTYGSRVALNKVTKLTTLEYIEETVKFIEPERKSNYHKGLHTISGVGDYSVIDMKRHIFVRSAFIYHLKRKINKLLRIKGNDK
jgi:hypothetical protein